MKTDELLILGGLALGGLYLYQKNQIAKETGKEIGTALAIKDTAADVGYGLRDLIVNLISGAPTALTAEQKEGAPAWVVEPAKEIGEIAQGGPGFIYDIYDYLQQAVDNVTSGKAATLTGMEFLQKYGGTAPTSQYLEGAMSMSVSPADDEYCASHSSALCEASAATVSPPTTKAADVTNVLSAGGIVSIPNSSITRREGGVVEVSGSGGTTLYSLAEHGVTRAKR